MDHFLATKICLARLSKKKKERRWTDVLGMCKTANGNRRGERTCFHICGSPFFPSFSFLSDRTAARIPVCGRAVPEILVGSKQGISETKGPPHREVMCPKPKPPFGVLPIDLRFVPFVLFPDKCKVALVFTQSPPVSEEERLPIV